MLTVSVELADTGSTFVDAADVDEFSEQTGTQTLTFAITRPVADRSLMQESILSVLL